MTAPRAVRSRSGILHAARLLAGLVAGLATGLATVASPARAAEPFVLLTNWYAQAEQGGFYQAQAEGLYDKAGLRLQIRMGGPQVNGMQLLLAGQADVMLGYDFQVLEAVQRGLPVVAIAAAQQHDLQGMMTHADVGSLSALKTRTILVATGGRTSWWPWFKARYGATDGQSRPYTFNLQPFLADPNVAQQAYPSSEPFQAAEHKVPFRFFLFADEGYPPYGTTIVTTQAVIDRKPELLAAFVKASLQGWHDVMSDPTASLSLIRADNPHMSDAQLRYGFDVMKRMGVVDDHGAVPIGSMTEARWKANYDYMVSAGLLDPATDWRRAFTTRFIAPPTATR